MPAGKTLWTTSSKLNEPWTSTDLAPLELANASAAAMVSSGELPPARAGADPASSSPSSRGSKRMVMGTVARKQRAENNPHAVATNFLRNGSKDAVISPKWVKSRHAASLAETVLLYAVAQRVARDPEQARSLGLVPGGSVEGGHKERPLDGLQRQAVLREVDAHLATGAGPQDGELRRRCQAEVGSGDGVGVGEEDHTL